MLLTLLEGENANKVEEGDRYFVKADSTGPMPDALRLLY